MKPARILLLGLGIVVVVSGLLLALALMPGVQRWAALRALREVPDLRVTAERVAVGFSGAVLEGVTVERDGVTVKGTRVEMDFRLVDLLLHERLSITRLEATGLDVDGSSIPQARSSVSPAAAPAVLPGLLAQVHLPFDLTLDGVRLAGRGVARVTADKPPVEVEYTLTGGNLSPGAEGLFQISAILRDPDTAAKVSRLRLQAVLRATLSGQRIFSKVSLVTVADAEGQGLAGATQLKANAELFRTSGGENYDVTIDTMRAGQAERLLRLRAQLAAASGELAGEWELNARTAQVESFLLGLKLPDFDLAGSGHFTMDPASARFGMRGRLAGQLSRLELFDPAWEVFGRVTVDTIFDGAQREGVVTLSQLKVAVGNPSPVLDANLLAPLRYDLSKGHLIAAEGAAAEDLLQVNLAGVPLAWLHSFVTGFELSGAPATGRLDVARMAGPGPAAGVRGQLELKELSVKQTDRLLVERASISLRADGRFSETTIEVPKLSLSLKTEQGDTLDINGRLSTRREDTPPVDAALSFTASSPKYLARWLPGAPVTAQGEIAGSLHGRQLDVTAGHVQVQQGTGKALAKVTVLQPFKADLGTHVVIPRDAAQSIARLELRRVPLGLIPVSATDATWGGFIQQGDFEIGMRGDKVSARSTQAVLMADVSLTQGRQPALRGLAIEARPSLEYGGPENFKLQSGEVLVKNASQANVLTFQAEAMGGPNHDIQAACTFALEIPALAGQPLFADAQAVSAGRATGEVRAALGEQNQIEARVTLNGMIATDSGQSLPVANIGVRILTQADGALSVQAPILLDNAGRRSDVNLELALSPLAEGQSVDGRLTGQQVELQDALGVLGVFLAAAAPANAEKPVPTGGVGADATAAWSRFSGQLELDLKAVTYGPDWAMTDLSGKLAIEPARLALDKLSASFSDTSRLAAGMEMLFRGGPMPYRLSGSYTLNDFDAGKLFRAVDPSKSPTVEGLFSITGNLSGNGETPGRAVERVHGDFSLTSRQGIFRGLQRASGKLSMTSKAVELGASVLGSIFGSEKATKTAEKVAGQAYHVDQLAQALGELHYDLLNVRLSRDELLNMNLQEIGLVAPELRLTGSGEIAYVEGLPLLEQPLTASLNLAARGKIEELLDKAKLLDGTKDELGYSRASETITLAGSLAKPDPSAFFTRIANAKINELLAPEN